MSPTTFNKKAPRDLRVLRGLGVVLLSKKSKVFNGTSFVRYQRLEVESGVEGFSLTVHYEVIRAFGKYVEVSLYVDSLGYVLCGVSAKVGVQHYPLFHERVDRADLVDVVSLEGRLGAALNDLEDKVKRLDHSLDLLKYHEEKRSKILESIKIVGMTGR